MKPLEDIFSKKKIQQTKEKCPNPAVEIIIDTREKQSLVAANLIQKKANCKFETLAIADYIIGEVAVERKTFSDFLQSIINKRLQEQLSNLTKYDKKFLILESFQNNNSHSKINKNVVRGMLLAIALDFQIPIIYTKDEEDTANFLIQTAKKYQDTKRKHISIRHTKNTKSLGEQKQFILEGFPGIGPTTAKGLLKQEKTLQNIFNLKKESLQSTYKFDEAKAKKFKDLLEK